MKGSEAWLETDLLGRSIDLGDFQRLMWLFCLLSAAIKSTLTHGCHRHRFIEDVILEFLIPVVGTLHLTYYPGFMLLVPYCAL